MILTTNALSYSYNATTGSRTPDRVIESPGIAIQEHTIYSLLGENMSGKSTLLKILSGHLPTNELVVEVNGKQPRAYSPHHLRVAGVATCHQGDPLFPELSISENLLLGLQGLTCSGVNRKRAEDLLQKHVLRHPKATAHGIRASDPLAHLSGGLRALVRLLRALSWDFQVVLLDEPTAGLDSDTRHACFQLLADNLSSPRSAVFVSHIASEHEELKTLAYSKNIAYKAWHIVDCVLTDKIKG